MVLIFNVHSEDHPHNDEDNPHGEHKTIHVNLLADTLLFILCL